MLDNIDQQLLEIEKFQSTSKEEIEQFRIKFNGKKGILNDLFAHFKEVPNEQKKEFGQKINAVKQAFNTKMEILKVEDTSSKIINKEDLTKATFIMFSWMQVFTASAFAFSHGSNDIANAVGPFAAIMDALGLDLTDDSLKGTPNRVAKMFVKEIFGGKK